MNYKYKLTASIFRVEKSYPESEGSIFLRNFGKYLKHCAMLNFLLQQNQV